LLIPLEDWKSGDLTFIASDRSWADKFSQLLKELQAVKPPELCADSSQVATKTFLPPLTMAEKPEVPISNFLPFERIPEGLRCFSQTRPLTDKESADLLRHWLAWRVEPKTVLSSSAPPAGSWNDAFKEQDASAISERVKRASDMNIVLSSLQDSVKMGSLRLDNGETDDLIQQCYEHLVNNHRIRQELINRFGPEMADSILDLFQKQRREPGQTLIKAAPARKGSLIKPH